MCFSQLASQKNNIRHLAMKWHFFRLYQGNWKEVAFRVGCQSGQQDELTGEDRHFTAFSSGHVCRKQFEEDGLTESKRQEAGYCSLHCQ